MVTQIVLSEKPLSFWACDQRVLFAFKITLTVFKEENNVPVDSPVDMDRTTGKLSHVT